MEEGPGGSAPAPGVGGGQQQPLRKRGPGARMRTGTRGGGCQRQAARGGAGRGGACLGETRMRPGSNRDSEPGEDAGFSQGSSRVGPWAWPPPS